MKNISPASFQQRQFYWLQNLDPQSSAYTIPIIFSIDGPLDIQKLQQAFDMLIKKQDLFRTTFSTKSGELGMSICNNAASDFKIIDMSSKDSDFILDYLNSFIRIPFTMSDSLYRTTLIQTDTNSYVWCTVLQHSISDLRTKELFADFISTTYNQMIQDSKDIQLKSNSIDYREYAQQQSDWINSTQAVSQKKFWKNALESIPTILTLPIDFQRPSYLKLQGTVEPIEFDETISNRIKAFSKQNGVTPYLCLLTAYVVMLGRYANQEQFIVGLPFTNRRDESLQNTFGCFVNTLPVPIDLRQNCTMLECMRSLRQTMLLAHRNQELPTELIVKELVPSGVSLDRNPLYQTGFTFEPFVQLNLDNCDVSQRYIHHGGSQLDLFATFWEENGSIEGVFEYNESLFKQQTIERWVNNFSFLVNYFLDHPESLIHSIPITTDSEQAFIENIAFCQSNKSEQSILFNELFDKSVAKNAQKCALTFKDKKVSYQELADMAEAIASKLIFDGVKQDQYVGVYMERSPLMLASMIGVLKAGAAYLPLDPEFPSERIKFIVNDSQLVKVLTQEKFSSNSIFASDMMIFADSIKPAAEDVSKPSVNIQGDSAAYMIYTSGSTGNPKGVIVTHYNLANFIQSMIDNPGVTANDQVMAITTISFDIHILELLVPLAAGATVQLVPRETSIDADALCQLLSQERITMMQATPTTWKMLCASGWKGNNELTILCGGEAMSQELAKQLLVRCKSLYNMYGPTETTVWSTFDKITSADNQITIGKPIANTSILIKDKWGNSAPQGCWGELLIGGSGVARGYHNRKELTETRFTSIKNSFIDHRFYATGDVCRIHSDGVLECAGRIDNQIKIRGYRIELEEIENVIEKVPGIHSAAVVPRNDFGDMILVAFIVMQSKSDVVESGTIRSFIHSKLPDYMIPSRFVTIEALPLTPNKKIDRNILRGIKLQIDPNQPVNKTVPANSDFEKRIAFIWTNMLHLPVTGIDENFFDAGGNSLLILQYKEFLRSELNVDVSTTLLLQYTTIRSLAQHLESDVKNDSLQKKKARIALQKQAMQSVAKHNHN